MSSRKSIPTRVFLLVAKLYLQLSKFELARPQPYARNGYSIGTESSSPS